MVVALVSGIEAELALAEERASAIGLQVARVAGRIASGAAISRAAAGAEAEMHLEEVPAATAVPVHGLAAAAAHRAWGLGGAALVAVVEAAVGGAGRRGSEA